MTHSQTPLHTLDPLGRFSNRADDYARYRPSYPPEAIDYILEGLGDPDKLVAADIGAGTGISSRLLAAKGVRVLAIEPNEAMRNVAQAHPGVAYLEGSSEKTGLDDVSVALVTAFQAYHWFEPDRAQAEFHRILKPGGRVAIVWNDRADDDDFTNGYTDAILTASNRHPAEDLPETVDLGPGFSPTRVRVFTHSQALDLEGLIGRARSASYVPREGPAHEQLLVDLTTLYNRFKDGRGLVNLAYKTGVYTAEAI